MADVRRCAALSLVEPRRAVHSSATRCSTTRSIRIQAGATKAASASTCSRAGVCRRPSTTGGSSFDHALTGEHVYDIDLIYSRTTYQFSRQFFVRGIAQYDSSRSRVLTDFLASYQLRPGRSSMPGMDRSSSSADSSMESGSSAKAYSRRASAACSSRRRTCITYRLMGFCPEPSHARSRGPRRPAPLAWLTRFRSFALFMRQPVVLSEGLRPSVSLTRALARPLRRRASASR